MTTEWTSADVQSTIEEAIRRGRSDLAFRNLALADPNKALEMIAGKPVPEGLKIKFFDGSDAHMTIVLPEYVEDESELTDLQLEQVAGGGRCAASCAASCVVSSTISIGLPGVGAVGGCL
jgi:hypothetical protein